MTRKKIVDLVVRPDYIIGEKVTYFKNGRYLIGNIVGISVGYMSGKFIYQINDDWVYGDSISNARELKEMYSNVSKSERKEGIASPEVEA
jgi:hypothetical protein